jgi:hypothetical protein
MLAFQRSDPAQTTSKPESFRRKKGEIGFSV